MPGSTDLLDARILVVDDVEADARLIAGMLGGSGYSNVTTSSDPVSVGELHAKHRYDLIVLDVLMPGMDGFQVLEKLRPTEAETYVPVIVVTAEPDHMKRALEAGARDFISKPIRMVELLSRAHNALELGLLLREARARGKVLETTLRERTADLRDAEGRFRAIVEQSIVAIYTVEGGRFTYANPRLCEWLGYTLAELRGIEIADLVVEEDRALLAQNRERGEAGDPSALVATYRLLRRDGRVLHLSVDGKLLELKGRKVLFGIGQDITERIRAQELLLEAESHYRALVEQSIVGIFLSDENARLIYANPHLCEIVGYPLDEMVGRDSIQLAVEEDRDIIREMRRKRLAGELSNIALDLRVRRKDGQIVHLSVESKLIELAGGKATIGVVQDVTLRMRAQDALERANERLRVLSRRVLDVQEEERRGISRELHDDVGQSLLALSIGLHRLESHVDEAHRGLLVECESVAASVRDKLRELSVELHPPHLDQLGLQDALRWLVNRQREMTGIAIECRFAGVEHARIPPAVESACYRICQEALTNATRHARANAIVVELALRNGRLELGVGDDGVGFDMHANREALLTSGSLGLISMEERARLAGGRLELATSPGRGTRIAAVFPIAASEPEGVRARERA